MINDLVWADPIPTQLNSELHDFTSNPLRGPRFGPIAVNQFFENNPGIKRILR